MPDESNATEPLSPQELAEVPEYLDQPLATAAYLRAAGTWDPMPWHVNQAYRVAGRAAQHAFWGEGNVVRLSMLHQLALRIA